MSAILAIDPGTTESAYLVWDTATQIIGRRGFVSNGQMLQALVEWNDPDIPDVCAIEMIESFGMPVGREVFSTCVWIGQFVRQWYYTSCNNPKADPSVRLIGRIKVKQALCHNTHAKDGNVRQAIIDRLGPPGVKSNSGKTYGISKHLWSALAVALTAEELLVSERGRI